jgi:mono/diheme cytochrome c family protein
MNTAHDYGDGEATSQLAALDRIGMFERPLEKAPAEYARLPDPFDEASANLEARVRAYLDVNCAMCHVNDGGGNANMVVSYNTELDKTRLIEETPMHDIGGTDMRVVAKGSPERSVLYTRMTTRAESQMPPSSTSLVDERGAALVAEWIRSLGR